MSPAPSLPAGAVVPYAGKLAKGDAGSADLAQIRSNLRSIGWLFCDGSPVSRKEYQALFGTIGYAFGGSGDSFHLPDLRGQFIRGVSESAEQDPGRAERTPGGGAGYTAKMVGSVQTDSFQEHQHNYSAANVQGTANQEGPELPYTGATMQATTGYVTDPQNDMAPAQAKPRTSSETRPVNIYLNYIIYVGTPT